MGIQFAASVLVGLGGGWWIGKHFGLSWPPFVGLLLGTATAFRDLYRFAQQASRDG